MRKLTTLIFILASTVAVFAQYECATAVAASLGDNAIPATSEYYYWYTYTIPSNSKLMVTSSSGEYVDIDEGACENLDNLTWGYENANMGTLTETDIIIRWETYGGGDFTWNLAIEPLVEGDICELPDTAYNGTNSLPVTTNDIYWYTYTMLSDGKLQITSTSNEWIAVYSGTCEDLNEEGYEYNDVTVTTLSSGDEVYIAWYTNDGGNFDWNIEIVPLGPGDNCSLAVEASDGINSQPATANSYYWYSYTMPINGKLQITSSSSESVVIYKGTCNNLSYLSSGYQNATEFSLTSGEQVFIRWDTDGGGDFDWNLSTSPMETGDNCSYAATAIEGTNTVPATTNGSYWYTYTMPETGGRFNITSTSGKNIYLRTGECGFFWDYYSGYENLSLLSLEPGEKVFIYWDTYGGGNFDWDLSIEPNEPGDNCSSAANASSGTNSTPATANDYYWFTYTMPSDGKLVITSTAGENVRVYSGTCGNLWYGPSGLDNVTALNYSSGDILYIRWETDGGGDFDWELNVAPFETGDLCSMPDTAVEGTNLVPATLSQMYWYEFVVPSDGKIIVNSSTTEYISVYTGICDNLISIGWGYGYAVAPGVSTNDTVLIKIETGEGGDFDWDISILPSEPGDDCSLAVTASEGTNSVPSTVNTKYWYTFTMPSDGKIIFTSTTPQQITFYEGSCDNLDSYFMTSTNIATADLSSGDEVFIKWNTEDGGDFDWVLTVEALGTGDNCELADEAEIGMNTLPLTYSLDYWYHYTMPYLGNLSITSSSSEWVYIKLGSCDDLIFSEYGYGSIMVDSLPEGENVLIQWCVWGDGNFNWNLSVQQIQEITFNPIARQDIDRDSLVLNATASSGLPISYTLIEGPVTLSENVLHFTGTGTVTVEARQTGNDTVAAAAPVQQSFRIAQINAIESNTTDMVSIYPNPVSHQLTIETGNLIIEQIQLYSAEGRLVNSFNKNNTIHDLSNLNPGIYILKINTEDKVFNHRLIKN